MFNLTIPLILIRFIGNLDKLLAGIAERCRQSITLLFQSTTLLSSTLTV